MASSELLVQDPLDEDSHFYSVVNEHLTAKTLAAVRVAMAYVSWGGLSLVAEAIERFLGRSGRLSAIFGVGNGVTTSDALCYAHYLQTQFSGLADSYGFVWNYCDSTFHSKLFEFEYSDHTTIIVGSANVTNGGLAANHELALSVTARKTDRVVSSVKGVWQAYLQNSTKIDPPFIRSLAKKMVLGREGVSGGKPGDRLGLTLSRAKKPLFAHILDGDAPPKIKHDTLSDSSTLSEKPEKLYLQILGETGGGHQVQLPVATLGTFFGVGEGETRDVSFRFSGGQDVRVQLTHFGNNTHRVRLRPIKAVPRPSILVFERSDDDDFTVRVVSQRRYAAVLREHCTEQTRAGSRHWGCE